MKHVRQSDKFIELREKLKEYVKLNKVFSNIQTRTKVYGQATNGVKDVSLTESEKILAKKELLYLMSIIENFRNEI